MDPRDEMGRCWQEEMLTSSPEPSPPGMVPRPRSPPKGGNWKGSGPHPVSDSLYEIAPLKFFTLDFPFHSVSGDIY